MTVTVALISEVFAQPDDAACLRKSLTPARSLRGHPEGLEQRRRPVNSGLRS